MTLKHLVRTFTVINVHNYSLDELKHYVEQMYLDDMKFRGFKKYKDIDIDILHLHGNKFVAKVYAFHLIGIELNADKFIEDYWLYDGVTYSVEESEGLDMFYISSKYLTIIGLL